MSSQAEAKKVIDQASRNPKKGGQSISSEDSDTSDDEEVYADNDQVEKDQEVSSEFVDSPSRGEDSKARPVGPGRSTSNVVEDVISKKGQYGRFADRWFSRKGWSTDKKRVQGMSTDDAEKPQLANPQSNNPPDEKLVLKDGSNALETPEAPDPIPKAEFPHKLGQSTEPDTNSASIASTLLPKLLRSTRMLLDSRSFFFSYDLDITRRLGSQSTRPSELSLHKSVDPLVSQVLSFPPQSRLRD